MATEGRVERMSFNSLTAEERAALEILQTYYNAHVEMLSSAVAAIEGMEKLAHRVEKQWTLRHARRPRLRKSRRILTMNPRHAARQQTQLSDYYPGMY